MPTLKHDALVEMFPPHGECSTLTGLELVLEAPGVGTQARSHVR